MPEGYCVKERKKVEIKDAGGLFVTSTTGNVVVNQTLTTIAVSPGSVSVPLNGTQQFTATARDQFGNAMSAAVGWNVTFPLMRGLMSVEFATGPIGSVVA